MSRPHVQLEIDDQVIAVDADGICAHRGDRGQTRDSTCPQVEERPMARTLD
jgi:hypothetical protein